MEQTTNLKLNKPGANDYADVAVLNTNMDKLDEAVSKLNTGKATLGADGKVPVEQLPDMHYDPTGTAVAAVQQHNTAGDAHADIRQAVTAAKSVTGTTNPTQSTVGTVGQFYINTATGVVFICTVAASTYTWKQVSGMLPQINVTVPTGATVTCTDGTTTLTAVSAGDACTFFIPNLATWTLSATQNGQTSTPSSRIVGVDTVKIYSTSFAFISTTLNDNSWETIQSVARASTGSNYWAVGDAKQITLRGSLQTTPVAGQSYWVYILGFNHNASIEGNNTIHFGFGRLAQTYTSTNSIALTDSTYGSTTSYSGAFTMNTTGINSGGWGSSRMRNNILGSGNYNPDTGMFVSNLPDELKSVLRMITKYTDNVGNGQGSVESNVTATNETLWLLSQFEVFGDIRSANTYEQQRQSQYQYYKNGNTTTRFKHNDTSATVYWWLRSAEAGNSVAFANVLENGNSGSGSYANTSYGVAPAFAVG